MHPLLIFSGCIRALSLNLPVSFHITHCDLLSFISAWLITLTVTDYTDVLVGLYHLSSKGNWQVYILEVTVVIKSNHFTILLPLTETHTESFTPCCNDLVMWSIFSHTKASTNATGATASKHWQLYILISLHWHLALISSLLNLYWREHHLAKWLVTVISLLQCLSIIIRRFPQGL